MGKEKKHKHHHHDKKKKGKKDSEENEVASDLVDTPGDPDVDEVEDLFATLKKRSSSKNKSEEIPWANKGRRVTKVKEKSVGFFGAGRKNRLSLTKPKPEERFAEQSHRKSIAPKPRPAEQSLRKSSTSKPIANNLTRAKSSHLLSVHFQPSSKMSIGEETDKSSIAEKEYADKEDYDTEVVRILDHENMMKITDQKTNYFTKKWRHAVAAMDNFAASHPSVFHDMCIEVSVILIPVLIIILIWDVLAASQYFEIPHYSTINYPGFMIIFHFLAAPAAMYGYMMRYLMGLARTAKTKWAVAAMVIHFFLLAYRSYMEWDYNDFRDQEKLRYEKFAPHD